MSPVLGLEREAGIPLYEQALYAPSTTAVDTIKERYELKQSSCLSRFKDFDLYRAYPPLQDVITPSQDPESQIYASTRNVIRSVEPQQMLQEVLSVKRLCLLRKKNDADTCTVAVPPKNEVNLAKLIDKSRRYQQSVRLLMLQITWRRPL